MALRNWPMRTLFFLLVCATCSAQTSSFSQFVETHPGMSKREMRKAKKAWEKNEVRLFTAQAIPQAPQTQQYEYQPRKPRKQWLRTVGNVALLAGGTAFIAYASFYEP